jgi:hypothetical protein
MPGWIAPGARYVEVAMTRAEWKQYAAANGLTGDWVGRACRYGMTARDLHALYLRQDGRCYLCGDPLPTNLAKAVVEHDHSCCGGGTSCGQCVRGIACAPCNRLIAAANDDPDRLRRIADNLEAANRMLGKRYGAPGKIFGDAPYIDTFLSNSEPACKRCQRWESNCACPALNQDRRPAA